MKLRLSPSETIGRGEPDSKKSTGAVGKRLIYPLIKQECDFGNHTISMMCQVLSVSRPDYYRWLHHEPTKRERETQDLKERISRIWLTSKYPPA